METKISHTEITCVKKILLPLLHLLLSCYDYEAVLLFIECNCISSHIANLWDFP